MGGIRLTQRYDGRFTASLIRAEQAGCTRRLAAARDPQRWMEEYDEVFTFRNADELHGSLVGT